MHSHVYDKENHEYISSTAEVFCSEWSATETSTQLNNIFIPKSIFQSLDLTMIGNDPTKHSHHYLVNQVCPAVGQSDNYARVFKYTKLDWQSLQRSLIAGGSNDTRVVQRSIPALRVDVMRKRFRGTVEMKPDSCLY